MRKRGLLLITIAMLFLLGISQMALAAPAWQISRSVIGSTSGVLSNSAYTLNATLGETVAGIWQEGPPYKGFSGFWWLGDYLIALPAVLK